MSLLSLLRFAGCLIFACAPLLFTSCIAPGGAGMDHLHVMEVSVPQQKMALFREGKLVKTYPADPTGLNRRMDPKILHRLGLTDGEMSVCFAPF